MEELESAILAAWKRVHPQLEKFPAMLAKRLGRRAKPTLTRPPRAWCLAIRASDHRIPTGCDEPREHQVTLTAKKLDELATPVHLSREYLDEAAKKLGTSVF